MRIHLTKPHHLHGIRVILLAFSVVALCLVRVDTQLFSASTQGSVLAYAVNTNRGELLSYTNAARNQNGLGGFAMNDMLNASAQNKAQDMIARNYWSHNTPDGTQPWWFFQQAGYSYSNAGENLAYGFADSNSTVTAWMNSAPHKANVLGSFSEVGFGIASGASYQGGENTVVVAHYATPNAPPPPPPVAPVAPPAAPPQAQATTTPAEPAATPAPTPTATPAEKPAEQKNTPPPVITAPTTKSIPLWQVLAAGKVPLIVSISILLLVGVAVGYGLTHRSLMRHALLAGENYAFHHPVIDASVLAIITLLVLLTSVGKVS